MRKIVLVGVLCGLLLCSARVSVANGEEQARGQILDGIISGLREKSEKENNFVKSNIELMCSLLEKVKVDHTIAKNFIEKVGPPAAYIAKTIDSYKTADQCLQSATADQRASYTVWQKEYLYSWFSSRIGFKDPRSSQEKAKDQESVKKLEMWLIDEAVAGFRKQEQETTLSEFIKDRLATVRTLFEAMKKNSGSAKKFAEEEGYPGAYIAKTVNAYKKVDERLQSMAADERDSWRKRYIAKDDEDLYSRFSKSYGLKDPRSPQEQAKAQESLEKMRKEPSEGSSIIAKAKKLAADNPIATSVKSPGALQQKTDGQESLKNTPEELGEGDSSMKKAKKLAADNPVATSVVVALGLAALTGLVYKVIQVIRKKQREKSTTKVPPSGNG